MKKFTAFLIAFCITALFLSACANGGGAELTVTFDAQGGTCAVGSKTVVNGKKYGELPEPSLTGYIFGGWYLTPEGYGNEVTEDHTVRYRGGHTLYAFWVAAEYIVSFDLRGGAGWAEDMTVTYGEKYGALPADPEPSPALIAAGKGFAGWEMEDGTPVTGAAVVQTAGNHTLYAVWKEFTYLNRFNDSSVPSGITYVSGPQSYPPAPRVNMYSGSAYSLSGNRSLSTIIYTKPSVAGFAPSLTIPKSAFGAVGDTGLSGVRSISFDIWFFYIYGNSQTSNRENSIIYLVLNAAGGVSVTAGSYTVSHEWQAVTAGLSRFSDELLQSVESVSIEFINVMPGENSGNVQRLNFYIDDLRCIIN